ncbi:hypothetical protein OQ939_004163, partial [Escherichia coli]|nr:hypothetical protein [Escherichia coli]
ESEKCAEPVAFINGAWTLVYYRPPKELGLKIGDKLYAAPITPVSVPILSEDTITQLGWDLVRLGMDEETKNDKDLTYKLVDRGIEKIRTAMLQGADGNSPVIPDGLRLALSNAGIAAPESDEMLAATCEKYIQALVTWVKDRKPFKSAVLPDGYVMLPAEPTHAMMNAWLSEVANFRGHAAGYRAMIAAAPQQEVK